jgi:hypothetical protein
MSQTVSKHSTTGTSLTRPALAFKTPRRSSFPTPLEWSGAGQIAPIRWSVFNSTKFFGIFACEFGCLGSGYRSARRSSIIGNFTSLLLNYERIRRGSLGHFFDDH